MIKYSITKLSNQLYPTVISPRWLSTQNLYSIFIIEKYDEIIANGYLIFYYDRFLNIPLPYKELLQNLHYMYILPSVSIRFNQDINSIN